MKCEVDVPDAVAEVPRSEPDEAQKYMPHLYYFEKNELQKIDSSHFRDKYLGLFFGASWCKYCVTFIDNVKQFKKSFPFIEIIYIPFDQTYKDYLSFLKKTNFYSLPFDNYLYICKKYNIQNLPSLMIIAPNNSILVKNAVQLIQTDAYVNNLKSLIRNYTIQPSSFKFNNRLYDLFCA
ncbi:plasmoredoxin, putative [Plasmodium ovale]|nr:thioredoxin-like redox-active protein, putative [Plasmodium ovale curtisi]SCP04346.1 plasmoredoxin, putative [Plasmodium ovale]